jgi:hypothetical protein
MDHVYESVQQCTSGQEDKTFAKTFKEVYCTVPTMSVHYDVEQKTQTTYVIYYLALTVFSTRTFDLDQD